MARMPQVFCPTGASRTFVFAMQALLLWIALLPAVEPGLHRAAILYAGMPMPALFSALAQRLGYGGYAATLLVASTVIAFFSVNAWIWAVMHWLG